MKAEEEKAFKTFNHGTDPIRLVSEPGKKIAEGMPTELHLKEDGALNNTPSLAIIIRDIEGNRIVGQISLQMLNDGLNELGYQIVKL